MSSKIITLAELATHKTETSAWMAIEGKVYDVTEFQHEHPGGYDILLDFYGKDATTAFHDIGHSGEAKRMMEKYLIGTLA